LVTSQGAAIGWHKIKSREGKVVKFITEVVELEI